MPHRHGKASGRQIKELHGYSLPRNYNLRAVAVRGWFLLLIKTGLCGYNSRGSSIRGAVPIQFRLDTAYEMCMMGVDKREKKLAKLNAQIHLHLLTGIPNC